MPVGAVLGGLVAEQAGLATVLVGASAVCLLAAIYPAVTVRRSTVEAAEAAVPQVPATT
jgi:predicted MFS family arabinose efflux permease